MRKSSLNNCIAETKGHCSFDCIYCCYQTKESSKHFRDLYNNQIIN